MVALKKILFITTHAYIPHRSGGSESSTNDLCCALQDKGWTAAVLSSLVGGNRLFLWNRIKAKLSGDAFPSDTVLGYAVYRGWHVDKGIQSVVRKFKPDIAVIQAGEQASVARELTAAGVPFIWYLRDVEFDRQIADAGSMPEICELFDAATVIANSEFTARSFTKSFDREAHVLPPLVSFDVYKCTGTLSRKYALFINPVQVKGVDIAFDLAASRPDIPFLFVEGWTLEDDYFNDLSEKARRLGNVTLRRRTTNVKELYRDARVLLAPSIWEEAWGRVVTEAQINGIPVLASSLGGLPESVGPH